MSAFMHDNGHINAILEAALTRSPGSGHTGFSWFHGGSRQHLMHADMNALGAMLLRENTESVAYRYNLSNLDNSESAAEYLGYLEQASSFTFTPNSAGRLTPIAAIKAIHSYEYQACEHPGWEASEARAFTQQLVNYLITCTGEYLSADTWRVENEKDTCGISDMCSTLKSPPTALGDNVFDLSVIPAF